MGVPLPSSTTTRVWSRPRSARLLDAAKRFLDSHAPLLVVAASTYLAVFFVVIAAGVAWARDDQSPSVRVLGAGSRLSILVTSGHARLLIASGSDAAAFGNALARARHPASRRVDIVVLAGTDADLPVASKAAHAFDGAELFAIDGPLVRHLDELGLSADRVIADRVRIRLPGGVDVTVGPARERDGNWSALVSHRRTRIAAFSHGEMAGELDDGASAVVLTNDYSKDVIPALPGKALVLPARSATLSELREDADDGFWALRISPGGAVRLTFGPRGLDLPGEARRIDPSPSRATVSARPLPVAPPAMRRTPA